MLRRLWASLSRNAVAYTALFFAVGGGAYAFASGPADRRDEPRAAASRSAAPSTAAYTVVVRVRQHFGDKSDTFRQTPFGVVVDDFGGASVPSAVGSAPFVGAVKDFRFDCPGIRRSAEAVLMFQSLGVQHDGNTIEVNPGSADQPTVYGGLPAIAAQSGALPSWSANVLLVRPFVLHETENVLRIRSRPLAGNGTFGLDDFVIDNVVLMYST